MRRGSPPSVKVVPPILKRVIPRTRLFGLLDNLRERPVIWVCGPAGCGKTTLVGSYLEARRLPLLWYQVDAGDKDPATFFYYMGLGAKRAAPRYRKPLPLLTPEYLPGLPTFTLRYFEALYSRLRVPFVVALDNLHELEDDRGLHEMIRGALSRLPQGLNAMLISRNDPPPTFSRMLANQEMTVLGWEELRLTQEESAEIIRRRSPGPLSGEDILHLHRAADGWAAGLVLILEWLRGGEVDPQRLKKASARQILDYFGNEIFDKLDHPTQDFLLKTALMPRMTAPMAEALSGLPAAADILAQLSSQNHFTERRLHHEPVYQYHSLFREFLLSRGTRSFAPDEVAALRRRAAGLLEEGGEIEHAAAVLCEAGDWEPLAPLILKHAPALLAHGRNRALERWLDQLPNAMVEKAPWLLYWRGACRMPLDPDTARPWFERAFAGAKEQGHPVGAFLAWVGAVEAICWGRENFAPLDGWIAELEALLGKFSQFPGPEVEARVAAAMVYALAYRQPCHRDFRRWASRALAYRAPEGLWANVLTLSLITYRDMATGDFREAARSYDRMLKLARSRECPPLALIALKYLEARHFAEIGQPDRGRAAALGGLEIANREGVHVMDYALRGAAVIAAQDANDTRQAGALLDEMATCLGRMKRFDEAFYHTLRARAALMGGNPRDALHHSEMALQQTVAIGTAFEPVISLILKARALHALGRDREAASCLKVAHDELEKTPSRLTEFYALMAEAELRFDRKSDTEGFATLRNALRLGKEEGYLNTLTDVPTATAMLCARALEAGIEVEYVQEIIRKRRLVPREPPYQLENWPWPLRVYTLGGFRLERDGEPIAFSGKVRQKPLLLLKALIALGGKDVKEEQVSDALWPEAEGDAAHSAFTTTLSRLRDMLGAEKAIRIQEGRATLDPRYCWVDAWAFERLIAAAEGRLKDHRREGREQEVHRRSPLEDLIVNATALYAGPFLPGEEAHVWTTSYRERLRGKFLRLIGRWGEHLESAGKWKDAAECYQRGLEVDELAEEFYQRLMLSYQQLGLRAEGMAAYRRCREVLSNVLGVEPSSKTEAIYRSLK